MLFYFKWFCSALFANFLTYKCANFLTRQAVLGMPTVILQFDFFTVEMIKKQNIIHKLYCSMEPKGKVESWNGKGLHSDFVAHLRKPGNI